MSKIRRFSRILFTPVRGVIALAMKIDMRDILVTGGLAAMAYGIWIWKPHLAFIIVGGIVFTLAYRTGK